MAEKEKAKIYVDSCCIISLATYQYTGNHEEGRDNDNDYLGKLLQAAEAGDILLYTSTLTVAECQYLGEGDNKKDGPEVQRLFDSILLSGHLFIHVSSDVFISVRARELRWKHGIKGIKGPDAIHVASALKAECKEFLTLDGNNKKGLLKKAEAIRKTFGMRVIKPSETLYLPDEYLQENIGLVIDEKEENLESE